MNNYSWGAEFHYFLIDWPFYTYGMAYYWTYESEALVKYTDITEDFHNTSSFSHAHSSAALGQKGELIFLEQSCRSDHPRHLIQTKRGFPRRLIVPFSLWSQIHLMPFRWHMTPRKPSCRHLLLKWEELHFHLLVKPAAAYTHLLDMKAKSTIYRMTSGIRNKHVFAIVQGRSPS